jgi:hypothetical protein
MQSRVLVAKPFHLCVDRPFVLLRQQPEHHDFLFIMMEFVGEFASEGNCLLKKLFGGILIAYDFLGGRGQKI